MARVEGQELQNRLFKQMDDSYRKARSAELEGIHNGIVEVIAGLQASPQNTLLVLEIVKQEVLNDCINKFFAGGKDGIPKAAVSE